MKPRSQTQTWRSPPPIQGQIGLPTVIYDALTTNGVVPPEHLADAGYISAGHIVTAREHCGIDLVGTPQPDQSWQKQQKGVVPCR